MQLWSDDRAVAVQVGAIILFAFVVIAIAGYQASVVPDQNNEIEFNHNQRVQGQLEDVEATIGSMPAVADSRTTTVDLSTSYPARTLFVNPPTPTGRLRTFGTDNGDVAIEIENAVATNGDMADYWDGGLRDYSTGAFAFDPNYNVYTRAPRTFVENSLVYNDFGSEKLTVNSQSLFDGDDITLIAVKGSFSEQGGTASVGVRPVSASSTTTTVTNSTSEQVTIRIVSRLGPGKWQSILQEDREFANQNSGGHVTSVNQVGTIPVGSETLNVIEFKMEADESYRLQVAGVGVGQLSAGEQTTNATYAVMRTDSVTTDENVDATVTVEIRDEYGNPKSDARVNATVAGDGDGQQGSIVDTERTTDENGLVTFTYETTGNIDGGAKTDTVRVSLDSDPSSGFDETTKEDVKTTVTVKNTDGSGTGGGSGGGAYTITFDDGQSYSWDVSSESSPITLRASTDPALPGVSTEFVVNDSSVATVVSSGTDPDTDSSGNADVQLEAQSNGDVGVYVGSAGSSDVINVSITGVGGSGPDTTEPSLLGASRVDDTTISVSIRDSGSGIEKSSIDADDFTTSPGSIVSIDKSGITDGATTAQTVQITLGSPVDSETVDVSIESDGISDKNGNTRTSGTVTATNMDGVAPTLDSASKVDDTTIQVTISDGGSGIDKSTIAQGDFTLSAGSISGIDKTSVTDGATGSQTVTINLQNPVDEDTITVSLQSDGIDDKADNIRTSGSASVSGMDGVAPTISNFQATNPSGDDIEVSFDSDETLQTITVEIRDSSGSVVTTLDQNDFTQSGLTYTETTVESDGDYEVELIDATDGSGNDGASSASNNPTTLTVGPAADQIAYVSGSATTNTEGTGSATLKINNSGSSPVEITDVKVEFKGGGNFQRIYEDGAGTGVGNHEIFISAVSDVGYLEADEYTIATERPLTDSAILDGSSDATISLTYFEDNQGPESASGKEVTVTLYFSDGTSTTITVTLP